MFYRKTLNPILPILASLLILNGRGTDAMEMKSSRCAGRLLNLVEHGRVPERVRSSVNDLREFGAQIFPEFSSLAGSLRSVSATSESSPPKIRQVADRIRAIELQYFHGDSETPSPTFVSAGIEGAPELIENHFAREEFWTNLIKKNRNCFDINWPHVALNLFAVTTLGLTLKDPNQWEVQLMCGTLSGLFARDILANSDFSPRRSNTKLSRWIQSAGPNFRWQFFSRNYQLTTPLTTLIVNGPRSSLVSNEPMLAFQRQQTKDIGTFFETFAYFNRRLTGSRGQEASLPGAYKQSVVLWDRLVLTRDGGKTNLLIDIARVSDTDMVVPGFEAQPDRMPSLSGARALFSR